MDIPPDGHYVTSGLMLFPKHEEAIDQILDELRGKLPAKLAIVTTRDGQFIAASGELVNSVDLVGLGSLIAGDLAASHQIARLTGVYGDFQVVLREGADSHIFASDAGPHMALFILAPGTVPVGWVRLLGLEASRMLAKVAAIPPDEVDPQTLGFDDKSLADRFDQALNKLWTD
jgi:predicted regulator of Ras-like GTPase activity (Roadblock/LC7/MglB family)